MPSLFYLHCCLFLAVLKVMQRMTQNALYVLLKIGKFLKSYFTLEQVMLNNYFTSFFLCFLFLYIFHFTLVYNYCSSLTPMF